MTAPQDTTSKLMTEVVTLAQEVETLRTERDLEMGELASLKGRIEALENRCSAMELRQTHTDQLLASLQLDMQRLHRAIATLQSEQTSKLDAQTMKLGSIAQQIDKVLDLLQPKAVL